MNIEVLCETCVQHHNELNINAINDGVKWNIFVNVWRFFYLNVLVICMCHYLSCACNSRSYHIFNPLIWFSNLKKKFEQIWFNNFHGHYMHCALICIFQVVILWKLWKVEIITIVISNSFLDFNVFGHLYIQLLKECIAFGYFVDLNYNWWQIHLNLTLCMFLGCFIYLSIAIPFDCGFWWQYVSFYLTWRQKQVHFKVIHK
jgi:hypothetical protein